MLKQSLGNILDKKPFQSSLFYFFIASWGTLDILQCNAKQATHEVYFICLDGYVHYQRFLNMGQRKKSEKKNFIGNRHIYNIRL